MHRDDNTTDFDRIEYIAHAHAVHQDSKIKSVTWSSVPKASMTDKETVAIVNLVLKGFPTSKDDLPDNLKWYWSMQNELYIIEGVPFKDRKMLIPRNLRTTVLEGFHVADQGVNSHAVKCTDEVFLARSRF